MVCVDVCALLSVKALVTAIEHMDRICREEAERSFADGVDYTEEEKSENKQCKTAR